MGRLRPDWHKVRFGEVVRLCKERMANPAAEGIERYVGLEHIETDNLRIRSWGAVSDGTTFTTRIRPGQVLFGKRRAYQRKVAMAEFDGVCSGDIYVFESADPECLLPELLPFICQTSAFFDHAVGTSAGSLSPRTNWASLAEYELALPPLEEQRRAATVLTSFKICYDAQLDARDKADRVLQAALAFEFDRIPIRGPLQTVSRPIVRGIDSPGPNQPGGVPYVRIAEMTGPDGIRIDRLLRTSKEKADAQPESCLEDGDIVIALRGVVGLPVWVPAEAKGANLSRGTARLSIKDGHSREFFYWALRSPSVRSEVLRNCTGWKGEDLREITLGALRELKVPIPPKEVQDSVAQRILAIASSTRAFAERAQITRHLMHTTLDYCLGGAP